MCGEMPPDESLSGKIDSHGGLTRGRIFSAAIATWRKIDRDSYQWQEYYLKMRYRQSNNRWF